ncbi:ATP-binding protein [Streptomyces sp. NPDC095613]|uniref:sensor histidine kinase n=1 Tax=Streptomyces sp. NPDC095613 TaxID=3155540 RepID=UPI00332425C3
MRPSLRSTAPALLISAVVGGLLCLWAVSAAPSSVRTPLAWGAGAAAVALTAAVTAAAHAHETARRLREHNAALARRADQLAADVRRGDENLRRTVAESRRAADEAARSEAGRATAVAACANAAGRMQALATSMLADLREMEHRHTSEDVLEDLLHLDHRTAQAGRLADSIAVLTGARSGRRWGKPIVMESILRGAMGRIGGYQRVRLHSTSEVAVAGHAAEGVMHALAELLDNAANFSPPTAEVHVYVEEVPAGIVITVEDSGLVMSDVQLRRAERAVTTDRTDLSGLSGTRLGLAVVGRLARKHGLTVSFRPSARGGTGALMLIPQELITQLRGAAPGKALVLPTSPAESAVGRAAGTGSVPGTASAGSRAATSARPYGPVVGRGGGRGSRLIGGSSRVPERARASADLDGGLGAAFGTGTGAGAATGTDTAPGTRTESAPGTRAHTDADARTDSDAGTPADTGPGADGGTGTTSTSGGSGSTDSDTESVELGESGLPKRRRGRTLAAALRRENGSAARPRSSAGGAGGDGDRAPAPAVSPATQGARFSSFRRAVRGTPDQSANPTHPEGEPR